MSKSYAEKAEGFFKNGEYDMAAIYYGMSVAFEKNIKKSFIYYNMGNCYLNSNRPKEGIVCLKKAIELGETKSTFYYNLAYGYALNNEYEKALRTAYKYKLMEPTDKEVDKLIGIILEEQPWLASRVEEPAIPTKKELHDAEFDVELGTDADLCERELTRAILMTEIDAALEKGDKETFIKLTSQLRNK